MHGTKSIISAMASTPPGGLSIDEGLGAVAASKLADLARGFILKARPIVVLHRLKDNSLVKLKLRRGLINHILVRDEDGRGEQTIAKSPSAAILLMKAVRETASLVRQGYFEV